MLANSALLCPTNQNISLKRLGLNEIYVWFRFPDRAYLKAATLNMKMVFSVNFFIRCFPSPVPPFLSHVMRNTQGSRYQSPLSPLAQKIKYGTKNHKLAKTSGEKNILPELPTAEPYNCCPCLSHLPWLYKSPINNSIIGQKTVKLTWIWWKRYKVTCRYAQFDNSSAHFPRLSSSIFMTLCRNYQSGINVRVASPTSRKFTQNVITWNSMSNTNLENKLITWEIIIAN